MTDATTKAHGSDTRRHKVTGDVHLVLRRGSDVLFGQRQNTGFEGIWTETREFTSELGRCVANIVSQEGIKLQSGSEVIA